MWKYYQVEILIWSDAVFQCFACRFRVVFQIPKFANDFF